MRVQVRVCSVWQCAAILIWIAHDAQNDWRHRL